MLIALIGKRIGGERVGLIAAAAIAALYPLFVAADGAPMSESLYGLLIAASLLVALMLRERHSVRAGGGARRADRTCRAHT